jgi:hypothetical protein
VGPAQRVGRSGAGDDPGRTKVPEVSQEPRGYDQGRARLTCFRPFPMGKCLETGEGRTAEGAILHADRVVPGYSTVPRIPKTGIPKPAQSYGPGRQEGSPVRVLARVPEGGLPTRAAPPVYPRGAGSETGRQVSRQEPAGAGPCRIQKPLAPAPRGWNPDRRAARPRFARYPPLPPGEPAKRLSIHTYFTPCVFPARKRGPHCPRTGHGGTGTR